MAAPLPVPGLQAAKDERAALQAEYARNQATITSLTNRNGVITDEIALANTFIASGTAQITMAVPTGVTLTSPSTGNVRLAWTAVSGASTYVIQTANNAAFSGYVETTDTASPYDYTATAGTTQYARIKTRGTNKDDSDWVVVNVVVS